MMIGRRKTKLEKPRVKRCAVVQVCAELRTVSDTKRDFLESYRRPLGLLYSTALNELLVQQHLIRYSSEYTYNAVFALGVLSVFDQLFSSLDDKDAIFDAYVGALCEDAEVYRSDAKALAAAAEASKGSSVTPLDASASALAAALDEVRASGAATKQHTKFFAIGLFRVLELAEVAEKAALESLVEALGADYTKVTKDLTLYKGMLSKMEGARELMQETIAREKKKDEERLKEKKEMKEKKEKEEAEQTAKAEATTPENGATA